MCHIGKSSGKKKGKRSQDAPEEELLLAAGTPDGMATGPSASAAAAADTDDQLQNERKLIQTD